MIYLIGGAPRVGKSVVAKLVADRQYAVLIAMDDLGERVKSFFSQEKSLVPNFSGDAAENTLTPKERVKLHVKSAPMFTAEVDDMVAKAVARGESLVIEGVQLFPEHVKSLLTQYGSENFRVLFIGWNDVDGVVSGIVKNTNSNNWLRESDAEVIRQVAEFVVTYSAYVRDEAKKHNLPYQERTGDFDGDVKKYGEMLM